MKPFFSVIISIYNKEKFIKNTLKSVLGQTFENFEVIVVNDGSTDDSLEIAESFKEQRIKIISQDNKGASSARNRGMSEADGQFIALLDGDDIWDFNYLENIYDAILTHPTESVFATAVAQRYADKTVPVPYNFNANSITILDYFKNSLKFSILTSSSVVFKSDILKTTGMFDITIKSGQDTDMWIRIGIHFPIVFIPKVLVFYVYDNRSLSNTTFELKYKPRYDKYLDYEKTNVHLKKVVDLNRYSMAILSKLYGDKTSFKYYKSHLSLDSLTFKKKIL